MLNIIMIEDNEDLRKKTVKMLKMFGYNVDEASDGSEGYKKIITNNYDLVICDIKMPQMDGWELLTKVRNTREKENILFIFLTGNIERADLRKGMTIGADDYITKPFEINELVTAINTCIKKRKKIDSYYNEVYENKIENIKNLAFNDDITGLPNEKALNNKLDEIIASKSCQFCGLILFKIIGLEEILFFIGEDSKKRLIEFIDEQVYTILDKELNNFYYLNDGKYLILNLYNNEKDIFTINEELSGFSKKLIAILTRSIEQDWGNITFDVSIGLNTVDLQESGNRVDIIKNTKTALEFAKKSESNTFKFYSKEINQGLKQILKNDLQKHISPAVNQRSAERKDSINNNEIYEIKIFFLYPHSVIRESLIKNLVNLEYEVYSVYDHDKLYKYLEEYNHSIVFINIDVKLSEREWEEYVKKIKNNPLTKTVRLGVMSFYATEDTAEKFLIKLMVDCGFVKLKAGIQDSKNIVLKTLYANEAKGKRKYIRINTRSMENITFTIKEEYKFKSGKILDISSVGMACVFDDSEAIYREDTTFIEIQLNLKGVICMVDGNITHHRLLEDGTNTYIIMFNPKKYNKFNDKIHDFIFKSLQESLERDFKLLDM